jgi:hypothetical protein
MMVKIQKLNSVKYNVLLSDHYIIDYLTIFHALSKCYLEGVTCMNVVDVLPSIQGILLMASAV